MNSDKSLLLSDRCLSELLAGRLNDDDLAKLSTISAIQLTLDSREVTDGSLFIALNGAQTDGRRFIEGAINAGAAAVFSELEQGAASYVEFKQDVAIVHLASLPQQLSEIAGIFYGNPAQQLKIIGITGTNGKTTVTQLTAQWLELSGLKAYTMGTLGNGFPHQLIASPNTTMNAVAVQQHLASALKQGADYVVMEVSSHGLEQQRVADLVFDVAVFTNLSRDHLDFHGDMASYARAKQQLFTSKYCRNAVINGSDEISHQWLNQWDPKVNVSCFKRRLHDAENYLIASDVSYHNKGIEAKIESTYGNGHLSSRLLGAFNLDNLLSALNALCSAGFELHQLLALAPQLGPVAGRMEAFSVDNLPTAVVDYAHTSDALAQALQALRVHCQGELIVVFGCGGDRDQGKRPLMAAAAEQYADKVIFTQDNSRSESPQLIFEQMLDGIKNPDAVVVEPQRAKAVQLAIENAKAQDIVLLAGKGHEDYQILNEGRVDYDERQWVQQVLGKAQ